MARASLQLCLPFCDRPMQPILLRVRRTRRKSGLAMLMIAARRCKVSLDDAAGAVSATEGVLRIIASLRAVEGRSRVARCPVDMISS